MRQPKPLRHWTNQIKSMFPNLSKPQAKVLAAFNAVARGLAFLGIPNTVEIRLRSFISNPRIDMAESCENLARSVIRAPPRKGWIGRLGGAPSTNMDITSRGIR